MSRATMYVAPEAGPMMLLSEFPNAWGGAARIWTSLSAKYFGDRSYWLTDFRSDNGKKFWALAKDPRLTVAERVTFAATFDRALVDAPHFKTMARRFREFVMEHPADGQCHLHAWAEILDKLASDRTGLDFAPFAVGWHHASVGDNLWYVPVLDVDGEVTGSRPYDLGKDAGHWFLFDELEAMTQ